MNFINRNEIANGVYFTNIKDSRFKTMKISVNIVVPLSVETASENALVGGLLVRSCKKYPDFTVLSKKLSSLYGADLTSSLSKHGESQVIKISVSGLDDRYSLDDVSIAKELINEFTVIEFENDADFSDLSHIPIAYTTDEILEFPINVFVDLEKMSLVKRYDNNREFDNEKYFGESEDKMYMILGNLEFDELVSVPDYVREEIEKDNALDMTNNRSLSL